MSERGGKSGNSNHCRPGGKKEDDSRKRTHSPGDEGVNQSKRSKVDQEVIYDRIRSSVEKNGVHVNQHITSTAGSENRGNKLLLGDTNEETKFCRYCGNDISEQDPIQKGKDKYHKKCFREYIPKCEEAKGKFKRRSLHRHVILMGISVAFLYGQKPNDENRKSKKLKRLNKITELLKIASALRNSGSGHVLIHLVGLAPGDNFTGAFDEFADEKLNGLINDGSSFDDVYKKQRLSASEIEGLDKFHDILVLTVERAPHLVTSDVKTKSALDDCIIDTPNLTLLKFVQRREELKGKGEKGDIPIQEELKNLQESRNTQAKAYFQKTNDQETVKSVFDKLKLAQYITAFSKLGGGGSYFLGIAEEEHYFEKEGYRSKKLTVKPVKIEDCRDFEDLVKEGVSQTTLVCDYDGTKQQKTEDLITISFKRGCNICQSYSDGFVVHIKVRPVSGLVFYDKDGPVAYEVDEQSNDITRLSVKKWFTALNNSLPPRKQTD